MVPEGLPVTVAVDVETDVFVVVVVVVFVVPPIATNTLAEISTPAMTMAAAMTR
jgi:hypothetical protein